MIAPAVAFASVVVFAMITLNDVPGIDSALDFKVSISSIPTALFFFCCSFQVLNK